MNVYRIRADQTLAVELWVEMLYVSAYLNLKVHLLKYRVHYRQTLAIPHLVDQTLNALFYPTDSRNVPAYLDTLKVQIQFADVLNVKILANRIRVAMELFAIRQETHHAFVLQAPLEIHLEAVLSLK